MRQPGNSTSQANSSYFFGRFPTAVFQLVRKNTSIFSFFFVPSPDLLDECGSQETRFPTTVFSFPIAAPKGATVTSDLTAIDHLEIWAVYRENWTEHNPSVTVNVHEDEWLDVGAWVYRNFDNVGGVSFLPAVEHSYKQAPYQEITKEEYDELVSAFPTNIPWYSLPLYELEDSTAGSQELACSAGGCDDVDITPSVQETV